MKIKFLSEKPRHCHEDFTVNIVAKVDNVPTNCAIAAEAVKAHFDAASYSEVGLTNAVETHLGQIEWAAHRMLRTLGGKSVFLSTEYFATRDAESDDAFRRP